MNDIAMYIVYIIDATYIAVSIVIYILYNKK